MRRISLRYPLLLSLAASQVSGLFGLGSKEQKGKPLSPLASCADAWEKRLQQQPSVPKTAFWGSRDAVERFVEALAENGFVFSNFIDVGAAIYHIDDPSDLGAGAMQFHKLWSTPSHPVQVHAFEPSDTELDGLVTRKTKGQVKLYHMVVADREGSVIFKGTTNTATANPRLMDHPKYAGSKIRRMNATTIDNLLQREGVTHIDILKTDSEGTEWEVLLGAHRLVSENRVRVIVAAYEDKWSSSTFYAAYPAMQNGVLRGAAPDVKRMQPPSLYTITRHLDNLGYDSYLLGHTYNTSKQSALHYIPLSGELWRDIFELGRDPKRWGRTFTWYDFVAVLRDSRENAFIKAHICAPYEDAQLASARLYLVAEEKIRREEQKRLRKLGKLPPKKKKIDKTYF